MEGMLGVVLDLECNSTLTTSLCNFLFARTFMIPLKQLLDSTLIRFGQHLTALRKFALRIVKPRDLDDARPLKSGEHQIR